MDLQDHEYYVIEGWRLKQLKALEKRLYAEKPLTSDERRDYANWLNQSFFEGLEGPVDLKEL